MRQHVLQKFHKKSKDQYASADKGHYKQKTKMCDGTSGSVFGITTEVSPKGYQGIPPSHSVLKADEQHQTLTVKNEVFLWGMKNLPKPLTAQLPQTLQEAQSPQFKGIVYDVDKQETSTRVAAKERSYLQVQAAASD